MCLARVEFITGGENEERQPLIDVARIDLTPSGLRVIEFTGTVKQLAGKIRSIDFIKSVAWIEAGKESLEGTQ